MTNRVEHLAEGVTLYLGDCREIMPALGRFDAVVTDPPYELSFMGKSWDASGVAFCPDTWRKVLRVLKPGGHMVAFGAPKKYHRLACAIEDAGFEIRDSLMWVFGQGFPKSQDVSKAIDKAAGAVREVVGLNPNHRPISGVGYEGIYAGGNTGNSVITAPATDAAREWQGWGTALKPAYEPIVLARKPLSEGTVAANVLRWGTGALNIDATRVEGGERPHIERRNDKSLDGDVYGSGINGSRCVGTTNAGRWPANLCHDGSQEVVDLFPQTAPSKKSMRGLQHSGRHGGLADIGGNIKDGTNSLRGHEDNGGSAARFFYCAKASKHDRAGSKHPTVKPVALIQWLIRMVTPPGGTILDPFAGSGTTGVAAVKLGRKFTGIELEPKYFDIACRRISEALKEPDMFIESPKPAKQESLL